MWPQVYDPLGNVVLSTLVAALPVVVLLGAIGVLRIQAHLAALLGLATALVAAVFVFGMPVRMALASAGFGAAYGLLPIGWIILNVIFLYQLTEQRGLFAVLRESIAASRATGACSSCWSRSASARSSRARPASARPWP